MGYSAQPFTEADAKITLKAGGSFVKVDPSGVSLGGVSIKMNAGGSAVKGSGQKVVVPELPGAMVKSDEAVAPTEIANVGQRPLAERVDRNTLLTAAAERVPATQTCQKNRMEAAMPIIVDTTVGSQFCQHALTQWANKGLLFLFTENAVDEALAGLRGMLSVDLETAGPCLIRAYDTRFLQVLSACQPDQMAELLGVESTWVWSVDLTSCVQWSGFRGTGTAKPTKTHKGRDFERSLSWAFGWPSCLPYVDRDHRADATTLTRFIAQQWYSGVACDGGSVQLEAQWQAFRAGESDTLMEPGKTSE